MTMDTQQVVETLGNMSVVQLIELTRELEQRWGVSATPQPVQSLELNLPGTGVVEQTEFTVELTGFPADKKMIVLKTVREILGLGLKEAKEFVEAAPKVLREQVSKADADELKAKLEAAGATVAVR